MWTLLLLAAIVRSFVHFRLQQNGAVTRMWRSCWVQPSLKERAIGADRCKKEGMLLQPLRWCCVDCVIHHERDVRGEQHHTYMWREQAIIEWSWHVNSIVACCHSAKLCAYAAWDFRSQQYQAKIMHLPTKSELSPTLTFFMDEMRIHTKRPMTTSTALKNCGVHKLCTYLYQKTPF